MKKLQVLTEDERYFDIFVPDHFTDEEIDSHCDQLFDTAWHSYSEYT
tara:strand:- start:67 stop:207 length:141 start_codon:yes stop_codon:yes gene_type:complete